MKLTRSSLTKTRRASEAVKRRLRRRVGRLRGRQVVHFLHVRKTGGSAVKYALRNHLLTPRYIIELHPHDTTLKDIPPGEPVIFFLRDPVSRFVSGFYSRQRCGRPRHYSPWRASERTAFTAFHTANQLALALSAVDEQKRLQAREAMLSIYHVNSFYEHWFGDQSYFLSRLPDIFFIGFQEALADDFERLKTKLQVPATVMLPADPVRMHRSPPDIDRALDDQAVANLHEWYANDYVFLALCRDLAPRLNSGLDLRLRDGVLDPNSTLVPDASEYQEK
jgi:hypothetical protein